jgi:hypothetical protein
MKGFFLRTFEPSLLFAPSKHHCHEAAPKAQSNAAARDPAQSSTADGSLKSCNTVLDGPDKAVLFNFALVIDMRSRLEIDKSRQGATRT